jgi:purine-binding chemotaxis protein CheW
VVREQPGPTAPAPAVSQPPAQEAAHPAEAPGVPVAPAVPKQPGPKVATPAPAVSQPAAQSSSSAEGSGASTAKTVAAGGAPEKAAVTDVSAAETSKLKTAKQPQGSPEAKPTKPTMADIYDGMDIGDALDHFLRNETELQMVAFYVGDQEFTVPTVIVQEVIHYSTPVKLPVAPPFVAGVINLRGKVTPLVYLRDILEVPQKEKREDRFIVICRYQGLQIGLIIEKVHSMYRVTQKDIDWGIEAHLGINVDYVSGLLKHDDHLIGIVAVDKIVTNILSDEKK